MIQIIPSILSITEDDYRKDIAKYQRSQLFKEGWVHIDFMDNKFVPNQSIEPEIIAKYPIDLHKEAHIMVANPIDWVDKLIEVGFERIIFHLESSDDTLKTIEHIKSKGLEVGLAINSDTLVEKLDPFISKVDVVLVMSIVAGFQGQPFIPKTLDKVRKIKSTNESVKVGVDGAIKDKNIKEVMKAGVDFVIVGSYLLNGDVDENLEILWEEINGSI